MIPLCFSAMRMSFAVKLFTSCADWVEMSIWDFPEAMWMSSVRMLIASGCRPSSGSSMMRSLGGFG